MTATHVLADPTVAAAERKVSAVSAGGHAALSGGWTRALPMSVVSRQTMKVAFRT